MRLGASMPGQSKCTTVWDGVRNPTARKNLRAMRVGDRALFYHSSAGSRTGVAGVVTQPHDATLRCN